jgi:hypothetical protein
VHGIGTPDGKVALGDGGLAGASPTITKAREAQSMNVKGFESGLVPIAFVAETRHA